MSAQAESWRVSTPEGVFETDLETLRQWISEGCVLPTDKVSKGNLNWIDAGRAPMLKAAFNGEYVPPVVDSPPANPENTETQSVTEAFGAHTSAVHQITPGGVPNVYAEAPANACYNHPDMAPQYVCRMCGAEFCKECPNYVSASNIPLCPLCGELCKPYEEVKRKTASAEFQSSGFGLNDFGRAIRYPLQHKVALVCGALVYALLSIGGFRTSIIAYVIMFGCMSHVISQVAWGRLDRSFMPDFSAFSLWDDLVVPIFLGIGITIVTWGPTIVLTIALVIGVVSSRPAFSPLPGGDRETAQESVGPSEKDLSVLTDPNADPKKLEEANRKLNELRPASQISREAERSKNQESDPAGALRMLLPYLGAGIVIVGLFLITLAWGVFYYPMALTVAGYTQTFGSVIDPMVGIDTIRRMRGTYFKAFGMILAIQATAFIVSIIVAIVTSPFALPLVGNLPAMFVSGTFTFYFNLVIACLLGLSLYKCADQLDISVD